MLNKLSSIIKVMLTHSSGHRKYPWLECFRLRKTYLQFTLKRDNKHRAKVFYVAYNSKNKKPRLVIRESQAKRWANLCQGVDVVHSDLPYKENIKTHRLPAYTQHTTVSSQAAKKRLSLTIYLHISCDKMDK